MASTVHLTRQKSLVTKPCHIRENLIGLPCFWGPNLTYCKLKEFVAPPIVQYASQV